MSDLAHLTKDGEIGIVTVSNPPANCLSSEMAAAIMQCLQRAAADEALEALVLIGSGEVFITGSDVEELAQVAAGQKEVIASLHPLALAVEDFSKPIVCAINGSASGPGLELAMACHYRICLASASLGLPDVGIGLIPRAGGTQRLPRLAGAARAAEMCAGGNPIKGSQAQEYGVVDRLVEGNLLEVSLAFARELAARGGRPRQTRELSDKLGEVQGNAKALVAVREQARRKQRGRIAPLKAIDAIEAATRLSFRDGCKLETMLYQQCLASDQFKALFHVFTSEKKVTRIPGDPTGTATKEIRAAGIVGAGSMGSGIAMVYANAGIPVILKDVTEEALARGMAVIQRNYASSVKKGRLSQAVAEKRMKLIQPQLTYGRFSEVDIAVEAVFEEMELKRQVFADLNKVCRPDAILASSTSTLDIDQIAAATSLPHRVVGHHYFAPPHVMRLIEMVRGKETAGDVMTSSLALAVRLGKVGVVVGNCRGFVGGRMYFQFQREAQFLVEEGARLQDVDNALYNFGMAMGPFATADLLGLDEGFRARKAARHFEQPGVRRPLVADRLRQMGRLGQKSGAGWYRYQPGDREPIPDAVVDRCIEECARKAGIARRAISPEEIIERTIFALINEGAKILEEGMAFRASDIDTIFINGYGFPAHRGGPMWFADTGGLERVYERVCEFRQRHGPLWDPAPLLKQLAQEGKSFAVFDAKGSSQ